MRLVFQHIQSESRSANCSKVLALARRLARQHQRILIIFLVAFPNSGANSFTVNLEYRRYKKLLIGPKSGANLIEDYRECELYGY